MTRLKLLIVSTFLTAFSFAQTGQIRGVVKNSANGEVLDFVMVRVLGSLKGAYTNSDGIYFINDVDTGYQFLEFTRMGFDTVVSKVYIKADRINTHNEFMSAAATQLGVVEISLNRQQKQKTVVISQITIKSKQLERIPTVGGEPDLVQYLQVLPGVVFSGDQGGQLYIRGGSPVMNRVMIDGLTIYNPFHSIGLFSVFDSDIIKTVDVFSAGFGSQFGGRISAIVDVQTRDGNHTDFKAKFNASPISAKVLLEGPIRKFEEGKGSSSYIISYKNSYLNRTDALIYPYINGGELPYSFSDLYAKYSVNSSNGSYFKVFGFDYTDDVSFEGTTNYSWKANGFGANFMLIPGSSQTIIDGIVNYSDYFIKQREAIGLPRESDVSNYGVMLNFTKYLEDFGELKYGLEIASNRTRYQIYNQLNRRIEEIQNTSELSIYVNYRKIFKEKFIFEPGLRLQRYASIFANRLEPRLRMKYNLTDRVRFKSALGYYSQNLMSAVSDRDVVNLFYGYLSGPDDLPDEFRGQVINSRLQLARHAVFGMEWDFTSHLELNSEVYVKSFDQLTNINRNKIFEDNVDNLSKPKYLKEDYIIEDGLAYGFDVTLLYENRRLYLWAVYSYNNISRRDQFITYQPHFDRRHNINLVGSYYLGEEKEWTANLRWNFGSGFPFTPTQGFYELIDFQGGATTDYTVDNGTLGILYGVLNSSRLPYYHRLDASIKREVKWQLKTDSTKTRQMDIILSVTNVYNRNNIFYFDRVEYDRVDQLPLLPSLSISYSL